MNKTKLAYCGDIFSECPRYIATKSGSIDALKESALLMDKIGWPRDLENPEAMKCNGCEDIENCEYGVKECCLDKGLQNCGQCEGYLCENIKKAFEITAGYEVKFKSILNQKEYAIFQKAFFSKKQNLEEVHKSLF
ncbi:MAG: DUF3795 domain-containing protein [Promethearchaeota archaeon]